MQWQYVVVFFMVAEMLAGGTLHLKTGKITTTANVTDFQSDAAKRFRPNQSHYLLEFRTAISQEQLDELTARGAIVTAAVPDNAVIVSADDEFSVDGLDLQFAGRLRPELKMSSLKGEAYVVEFHSDVNAADARDLLLQQGMTVLRHADLQTNHFLVKGPVAALADWDEVAYIFPASADLIAGREVYACASQTSVYGAVPMFVKAGDGWSANGLNGATLQYTFSDLTTKVPEAVTIQEVTRALMEWPKHANLHWTPGLDPNAARTVAIKFAAFDHGDGYPFDGAGGILAHTFYPSPVNPEPIAGDMHLDASESWHSGTNVDLYTVALHEAGHALGLGHTDQPGAIMYPYYRLGAQISNDDIAGIESLYGPATASSVPTPVAPILLTITIPAGGKAATTSATIPISGIVDHAVGSLQVNWQTDHGNSGVASGTAAWLIASVPLTSGSNTVTVSVLDSMHQSSTQSAVVTRSAVAIPTPVPPVGSADTVAPTIAVTSPNRTIVQTRLTTFAVTGTAADNVGVSKVTWQNTLSGTGTATGTNNWSAAGIPLFPGTNTLILKAWDSAGNSSWRSITVVRN